MKKIIAKTFGLRDDEIHISFLMFLYIFIVITVLLIIKPTVNALFVSKLGANNLPFGYLLVAGVAVFTSFFYNRAIRKFSLVKVTVISLITFCLVFLALSLVLRFSLISNWILYFYYVFVSLFAVLATSQFWIFANMVFNAREAKRNFGFIGAGGIAGGIFGGYLTSVIASNLGNEFAIFFAAVLLLFCIPILKNVWDLRIRHLNTFKRKQVIANQDTLENSSLRLILKSKHLTYIALITGIGVIVAKLIDFQFSDFANKAIPDSDELAAFFGFWFSTFNVVALTIQLFLTNKILTKLGVSSTLLILPLTIAFGSLLFLTFPELWVLVLIKGIDGSAKQSLNKSAIELSIMPIPLSVKNQAKSYIDVAIDSIATGFAGFLLIFLIKRLNLETSYITVIILLFTFIWILFIYRLREAYFNSFKTNIQKIVTFEAKKSKPKRSENTIADVKNIFENGSEEAILSMFDRLKDYKETTFNNSVIKLLNHPSNKIKAQAIDYLDSFEEVYVLDKIEPLVYEKDDTLVYFALDYILAHSPITDESFFNKYLDHTNSYIANGALLSLAKQSFNNSKLGVKYNLIHRLEKRIAYFTNNDTIPQNEVLAGLLMSVAYARMTNYYKYISMFLKSDTPYFVEFATIAAGITSDEIFIDDLLRLLKTEKYRKNAITALKEYGPKIIDIILKIDKKHNLNPSVKRHIPKVIESFNNDKAVKVLTRLLRNKNTLIRLEASASLSKLKNKKKDLYVSTRVVKNQILRETSYYKNTLEIIISLQHIINKELANEDAVSNQEMYKARKKTTLALEELLDIHLKCIFNMLGLIYNKEDINMTYVGIQSDIKEARINSLEFLDNILQKKIRMMVLPIIENYVVDNNHLNSSEIDLKLFSEKKCLQLMIMLGSYKLRKLSVEYISISKNNKFIPILLPLNKFRNKTIKDLATKTYHNFISDRN